MPTSFRFKLTVAVVAGILACPVADAQNSASEIPPEHHSCPAKPAANQLRSLREVSSSVSDHPTPECSETVRAGRELRAHSSTEAIEQYRQAFNRCENTLLGRCSSDLKPEIAADALRDLFAQFLKDPLLRQPDPAGLCQQRSYLINQALTQAGYKAETLVMTAPTIAALNRDARGVPVSAHTYSFHVVSSVQVKNRDGSTTRMILDPQFFDRPVPADDYFRRTTGLPCRPSAEPAPEISGECRFSVEAPNVVRNIRGEGTDQVLTPAAGQCGWSHLPAFREMLSKANQRPVERTALPAGIATASDAGKATLIWAAQAHLGLLTKNIRQTERRLETMEKDGRDPSARGDTSVSPEQIQKVRAELTELRRVREDYARTVTALQN